MEQLKQLGRRWEGYIVRCFLTIMVVLMSTATMLAEDYVGRIGSYKLNYDGAGKITFEMPVYDQDGFDSWVYDSNVSYVLDGTSNKVVIVAWSSIEHDIPHEQNTVETWFSTQAPGTVQYMASKSVNLDASNPILTTEATQYTVYHSVTDQSRMVITAEWTLPRELRGKKITIVWQVNKTGNEDIKRAKVEVPDQDITITNPPKENDPILTTPVLSYEAGHIGETSIPWMLAASNVQGARLYYNDQTTKQPVEQTLQIDTTSVTGMLYVPADHLIKDLYLSVDYKDTEGTLVTDRRSTPSISVPTLHLAKNLTAQLKANGSAVLKWQIDNPKWEDIMDSDQWEIQRNLTGSNNQSDANWESIGMIGFDNKQTTDYEFVDEGLAEVYNNTAVSYRVRRVATANWGWTANAGIATIVVEQPMTLPVIESATVKRAPNWGEDFTYNMLLSWETSPSTDGVIINEEKIDNVETDKVVQIASAKDWKDFADRVNSGEGSLNAVLTADVKLAADAPMVGTSENSYSGIFDGQGHKLTVSYNSNADNTAPFSMVAGGTIINLHVDGSINCGKKSGGIVGTASNLTLQKCRSSVKISMNGGDQEMEVGGLCGRLLAGTQNITDCRFDGEVVGSSCKKIGGFVGDRVLESKTYLKNCYFNPNKMDVSSAGSATFVTYEKVITDGTLDLKNCLYRKPFGDLVQGTSVQNKTANEIQKMLGDQWMVNNKGLVLPLMTLSHKPIYVWNEKAKMTLQMDKYVGKELRGTDMRELTTDEIKAHAAQIALNSSCVDYKFRLIVDRADSKMLINLQPDSVKTAGYDIPLDSVSQFHFDNNVQLDSLKFEERQTSVMLAWTTRGGTADYFRITRRDLKNDSTVVLEEQFYETRYVDNHVRPQHNYEYTIEGVTQCEGNNISKLTIVGHCKSTGMVRGYVRLFDGTALAGRTVVAVVGDSTYKATTNETGFFEIGDIVYSGEQNVTLTVETNGEEKPFATLYATFNDLTNLVSNLVFRQDDYYLLSGLVMYDGTSVPVIGAQFERDGIIVRNGSGKPVTTNSEGKFSVSIPQGTHTIRVVKEGHTFANDGFYLDPFAPGEDKTQVNWQKSVPGHVFWDQTTITMQGRVVGGNVQGEMPLGQSLSTNNLGDSLTIVMQLEGDNTSWMVRDQLDPTVMERHLDYPFGVKDTCKVDIYRHRMVVHPDPVTGEYCIPVLPVKYKVTQVSALGYSTLFQPGQVGETVDFTRNVLGDTVTWKRIYHAEPMLQVKQFNMGGKEYMGIDSYKSIDNTGRESVIKLWNDSTGYAFGYPVFMAGSSIIMNLSAQERYYWNNDVRHSAPDIVLLNGGSVTINNGLISTTETATVQLDSIGEGNYIFTPQNLTFTEEGDLALKTMNLTLLYDGTYYDVSPVKGFVMAAKAKSEGRRIVNDGGTYLIDILRDPPGSGSSAYIESGSKISYSFTENVKAMLGMKMSVGVGGGSTYFTGVWAGLGGGAEAGLVNSFSSKTYAGLTISTTYYNNWQHSYTFETGERISTGTGLANVGRDADVFIGATHNAVVEDAIAVRAIDEETYQLLTTHQGGSFTVEGSQFNVKQGTMKVLAEGESEGKKVYLVRDEVLSCYTTLRNTFAHSQVYIEQELIPNMLKVRNTLLLPAGTSEETARQMADQQGYPVYISKVAVEDKDFGSLYTMVEPTDKQGQCNDSIAVINRNIVTWIQFMAENEYEKLNASDLVKSYDFDGRTSISYSETFALGGSESRYWLLPGLDPGSITLPSYASTMKDGASESKDADNGVIGVEVNVVGVSLKFDITPLVSFDYNYTYGKSDGETKKVGFTLAASNKSNLVVDVYRTKVDMDQLRERAQKGGLDDLFQITSEDKIDDVKGLSGMGFLSYFDSDKAKRYRSLVYRTRGGATVAPYEDARYTKYYSPGTLLDAKTVEIDKLRIWTDQASVSNVPYGEPARFTVYMANESEAPALASFNFNYYLNDKNNTKGAKVTIDGASLSGEGHSIYIPVGEVVAKKVEIYAGSEFDYENIGIGLFDPNDPTRRQLCYLSAHYVPTAGNVHITLPGNKWVVNTESAYDGERQQYYMPVQIDGFDVNFRNFDHIELQYKLSTQGDNDWVNVCSFYNDSTLMAKASGVCEMIENDGHIIANFFGEKDPIEQNYDLRAVNYCRYGNGFLTKSSEVLTGIKDTRRPQLFGVPQPANGILGIGSDLILRFSEPIAGNYLSDLNNFQVIGTTNQSNITQSTNLRFDKGSKAYSESRRNLGNRSFTVDVMLNPDQDAGAMTFFSHGTKMNSLELGLTADSHLAIGFSDTTFVSEKAIDFNGLRQVAFVFKVDLDNKVTTVTMYDGSTEISSFQYNKIYSGVGNLNLGTAQYGNLAGSSDYQGQMLEFRLWNQALTRAQIGAYAQKKLTGYELGLLDNYSLSEGIGRYSYNKSPNGNDLQLKGTSWRMPAGLSMKLDGVNGFRLNDQLFNRDWYQDYTLSFWFRTPDEEGTLLANGLGETESNYKNHFNFMVHEGKLGLKLNGLNLQTDVDVDDDEWHNVALTVNRSRNVGNLYVDNGLKRTFAVDTLGGIIGSSLAAGAVYTTDGVVNPIHGNIDEIKMYEMVLPESMITEGSNITDSGFEMGLMAYASFSQYELQMDNSQRLMPTGLSLRRRVDRTTGQLSEIRDTIAAPDVVEALCDRVNFAPMRDMAEQQNINFSYVAEGSDLLISFDVPEVDLEKCNVKVTVKEVADLNGNTLASPVMMDLYVYKSPLRWSEKRINQELDYGVEHVFEAKISNLSGKNKNYTIQGLPLWMTASKQQGRITALDEEIITFTVSPYINVGDYDEVIYLMTEDGMVEPMSVNLKVRDVSPAWKVDDSLKAMNISMHAIVRVVVDGEVAHDSDDMLAVFGVNHELLGVTKMDVDNSNNANEALAFLTIYNRNDDNTPLHFEFWDASRGRIYVVEPQTSYISFKADDIIGSTTNPLILYNSSTEVQCLPLNEGWNWVSFYVQPKKSKLSDLLNASTLWQSGDALEIVNADGSTNLMTCRQNNEIRGVVWEGGDEEVALNPKLMYRLYSTTKKDAYIMGEPTTARINVKKGWNRIGYISPINLPVATALGDYTDDGTDGDIIKSQSEFAVLSIDAQGNHTWKGTLKYMRAGEGYMLRRMGDGDVAFDYPTYDSQSRYTSGVSAAIPLYQNVTGSSMNMVAVIEGIDLMPGDRLIAYTGAESCGITEQDEDGRFFVTVGQGDDSVIRFAIEREGTIIATAPKTVPYEANAVMGTLKAPAVINFMPLENVDGEGWYTLQGIKLQKRPTRSGVYVHDGKTVIIK